MSEQVTYDREVLTSVLDYHHWRTNTSGCGCGWRGLGASHPEHVADVYEESVAARARYGEGPQAELGDRLRELSRACRAHADPGAARAYEHAGNLADAYVYGHGHAVRSDGDRRSAC